MFENQTENAPEMVENQVEVAEVTVDPVDQRKSDNLVQMRRKLEAAEEQIKESNRRAEEAERRSIYKNEAQITHFDPEQLPDDPLDMEDEDFVQAKYVKNSTKKMNSRLQETTNEIKELKEAIAVLRAEKATDKMTDFDNVVSKDNLKILQSLYPDEYEVIMSSNNLKSKSVVAYNTMLKYGIAEAKGALKQVETLKAIDKRIDDNKSRPGSLAAARQSTSPLTNASRYDSDGRLTMTDADRDRINKDMRRKLGMD